MHYIFLLLVEDFLSESPRNALYSIYNHEMNTWISKCSDLFVRFPSENAFRILRLVVVFDQFPAVPACPAIIFLNPIPASFSSIHSRSLKQIELLVRSYPVIAVLFCVFSDFGQANPPRPIVLVVVNFNRSAPRYDNFHSSKNRGRSYFPPSL